MTDVDLEAKITLQDDASQPLAGVKAQLMGLTQGGIGAATAGSLLAGTLTSLASGALSVAMQVGETAWALGEMGAQSQRTQASFERLASGVGESGAAILQAMQEASRGTVANADLIA